MSPKEPFLVEIHEIFSQSRKRIEAFPEYLRGEGLAYLSKANPLESEEGGKNRICYLLPFWMEEQCRLGLTICREMAVGNIFLMLYFFIQDDIMDTADPRAGRKLPIANLYYGEFLRCYAKLFPGDHPFWDFYRTYVVEWAVSVSREAADNYFIKSPGQIAGKSSPLKLCSTGALLLSGQEALIPQVSSLIESALVALQMADDWADWEIDLADGNYNSLLALLRSERMLPSDAPLTQEQVRQFLYVDEGLTPYALLAAELFEKTDYAGVRIPHLRAFHEAMVINIQQGADEIRTAVRQLEQGGLHYWLGRSNSL